MLIRKQYISHLLPVVILLATACSRQAQPIRLQGQAQGTTYSITYYDPQQRNLQSAIDSLLDDFDQTASLWVDSSLIRRVNDNSDSVVNELFATLVDLSVLMHDFTGGAFDCTVGKLVNAWGFGFSKRETLDSSTIDSLLRYVGQQPEITRTSDGLPKVCKPYPETTFDFNAIAQGYSTDLVARFLEQQGIDNYLVDIGGEVYAKGCKADGTAWRIGIERPAENRYSSPEVETAIELHNLSVVTSGSYRKYYEKDGLRYSHTIDPSTGRPVEHSLLSVSVVDTAAWRADALATAFMVMGLDRAKQFIEEHPNDSGTQAVFFIYSDGDGYKTYATNKFNKLIKGSK
jgi:thiamine biosynthesis lipoprotein